MRDSAHAGRFDDLEAFCIANGLTFVVHSSAGDEADAELRWWAPGFEEVRWADALENGSPVFTRAGILEAMGDGACAVRLARLEAWLDRNTPPGGPAALRSGGAARSSHMNASATTEPARINGRGHARGWHAQQLEEKAAREGRTMADVFLESIRETSAFNVPAEAVRLHRGRVFYRFADGSEADFPHVRR